jgi:formate dehydrogenase maturation protein FdhE
MIEDSPPEPDCVRWIRWNAPRVWCDTCQKIQRMIFDVMPASDRDVADIVCDECKSIIATLHTA